MILTLQDVDLAYRKLKRSVYYDKTDLPLRLQLAEFDQSDDLGVKLNDIVGVLNSDVPREHPKFIEWLSQVSFRVAPKSFESARPTSNESARFISNKASDSVISVKKINYFFFGPVELHVICVVWLMFEGFRLDGILGSECFGARLESQVGNEDDRSHKLYKRYHQLYKDWRDSGIKKAQQMLSEEGVSVCILGLDIREYYYHANLNYNELAAQLHLAISPAREAQQHQDGSVVAPSKPLECVEAINRAYAKAVRFALSISHNHINSDTAGLPIGLISSPLLANWYLKKFDEAIFRDVRPAFYGRYVDDIFIVVRAPSYIDNATPVASFMHGLLVKTGVLRECGGDIYEILERPGLYLQGEKCILQHFDVDYSTAGLNMFKKRLEQNGSDFKLLPLEDSESSLEHVAYDLLYEGSVNKFRSVKGVAENKYELAKYLAKQSTLNLLSDINIDPLVAKTIAKFFKGKNAIEFFDLWGRVFSFFVVSHDSQGLAEFQNALKAEIVKVSHDDMVLTMLLQGGLFQHLELSLGMARALQEMRDQEGNASASLFRNANLLRHHLVREPLLNYTDYKGDLTGVAKQGCCKISETKIVNSPRSLTFDECMLLYASGLLRERPLSQSNERELFVLAEQLYMKVNRYPLKGIRWRVTTGGQHA